VTGKVLTFRQRVAAAEHLSDEAIVAACAVGDVNALGQLFDRHHLAVYRFLARMTFTRDRDLDDLVQTTFLQAYRSAASFRGGSEVLTWVFGIGANVARKHRRSEARRRAFLEALSSLPEPPSRRPDDELAAAQALRLVERAIASLRDDQRAAFLMCEVEGIPGVEVARTLGVPEGTLWRWLHEARNVVRKAVDGE
jgi:RNA polymerase sigma-70 factor (ECF subfamily)